MAIGTYDNNCSQNDGVVLDHLLELVAINIHFLLPIVTNGSLPHCHFVYNFCFSSFTETFTGVLLLYIILSIHMVDSQVKTHLYTHCNSLRSTADSTNLGIQSGKPPTVRSLATVVFVPSAQMYACCVMLYRRPNQISSSNLVI